MVFLQPVWKGSEKEPLHRVTALLVVNVYLVCRTGLRTYKIDDLQAHNVSRLQRFVTL